MNSEALKCPRCHIAMEAKMIETRVTALERRFKVDLIAFVCPVCGFEAGTPETAGELQRAIEGHLMKQVCTD